MERHFTASAYIFHENRVLLHKHAKLGKWLPPGGHAEPNETPPQTAKRETKEESGLEIALIELEYLKVEEWNAVSFEKPFACLLQDVPAHKETPAHQHMDFVYLARPVQPKPVIHENFRWFTYQELQEIDIFPDTRAVLAFLFKSDSFLFFQ